MKNIIFNALIIRWFRTSFLDILALYISVKSITFYFLKQHFLFQTARNSLDCKNKAQIDSVLQPANELVSIVLVIVLIFLYLEIVS